MGRYGGSLWGTVLLQMEAALAEAGFERGGWARGLCGTASPAGVVMSESPARLLWVKVWNTEWSPG